MFQTFEIEKLDTAYKTVCYKVTRTDYVLLSTFAWKKLTRHNLIFYHFSLQADFNFGMGILQCVRASVCVCVLI